MFQGKLKSELIVDQTTLTKDLRQAKSELIVPKPYIDSKQTVSVYFRIVAIYHLGLM